MKETHKHYYWGCFFIWIAFLVLFAFKSTFKEALYMSMGGVLLVFIIDYAISRDKI